MCIFSRGTENGRFFEISEREKLKKMNISYTSATRMAVFVSF